MWGLKYIEEGLIDTLHTMLTKDKISMSDYRMWFHINNKTKISILTPLGETDGATIMNSKGQGSSSAALASSLNMCSRRYNKGNGLSKYRELELNSLNFPGRHYQDESYTRGCKKGCKRCWKKHLRANTSNSKFVVIGVPESRTDILKEAEANPIKMADTIIENSKSEKYLGDQIHEDGTAASIHATLDSRIPTAVDRGNTILFICNQPSLIGFNIAHGPVEQYK